MAAVRKKHDSAAIADNIYTPVALLKTAILNPPKAGPITDAN